MSPHPAQPHRLVAPAWTLVGLAPLLAAGCTIYDCPTVYEPRAVIVDEAPPPVWERVAEAPEKPAGDAVWVEGYWDWQGRWIWVEGHWETGRSHQTWTDPSIVRTQGGYEYHPGYWRPEDTPPSPTYRRRSDVRVSARVEARAGVSSGGGAGGGSDAVRTQDADNQTRRETTPTTTPSRGTTTATGSGSGGNVTPARGSTGGGATATPSTATPSTEVRTSTGTATPTTGSSGTGSTRPTTVVSTGSGPGNEVAPPSSGSTVDSPRFDPSSGREPTPGDGTDTTIDDGPRGVAAGPLACEMEAGTLVAGGYANVRFPEGVRGRPRVLIGSRNAPIVAQQNQFTRVRVQVPMIGGDYSVIATDEIGRRGACGRVSVLMR